MTSKRFEHFQLSVRDRLGRLVIKRPQTRNALSRRMWEQLPEALGALVQEGATVVVITGWQGFFASGADLAELSRLSDRAAAFKHWQAISGCLERLSAFELPTIAMINGPCLGGGCLLALACDLRYASSAASFSVPIARLGIVLDDVNIMRLVDAVGSAFAREMIFRGHTVAAREAALKGLVNAVVEPDELEEYVSRVAYEILDNAAVSIAYAKRSMHKAIRAADDDCIADEETIVGSYVADEFRRRVKAFSGGEQQPENA